MVQQISFAFVFSSTVVAVAVWRRSLSRSGAAGALLVGTLTLGLGGWVWGLLLGLFFISSSLLSHFKEEQKRQVAADKFSKGHQRDFAQAMANGGLGALLATLHALLPWAGWFPLFVGVMASVNADTWATELGTLSRRPPRLITTGRVVEPGTSGAISPFGTFISFVGGLLIGLLAGLLSPALSLSMGLLLGGLGGISGSLFDSLLGATVQRLYYSDEFQKETEKRNYRGYPTRPIRGWFWMDNDVVNLLASLVGGGVALGLWHFLPL
jgi:uncharacterized protein (TIGR00297 family)